MSAEDVKWPADFDREWAERKQQRIAKLRASSDPIARRVGELDASNKSLSGMTPQFYDSLVIHMLQEISEEIKDLSTRLSAIEAPQPVPPSSD